MVQLVWKNAHPHRPVTISYINKMIIPKQSSPVSQHTGGCPQLSQQGYCCDLEDSTVNRGELESSYELAFHPADDKQLILLCRLFQGGGN